jgi:pimeloyl-ACP methyl ester carboxylesterase
MTDFDRGRVRANNLTFEYLTMGEGPLALCVHGFPDSPYTYRYLLPALAEAGYRAVAPFNRGFAPSRATRRPDWVFGALTDSDALAVWLPPDG